jgi:hypothetical protein
MRVWIGMNQGIFEVMICYESCYESVMMMCKRVQKIELTISNYVKYGLQAFS